MDNLKRSKGPKKKKKKRKNSPLPKNWNMRFNNLAKLMPAID
jgi:hypothetical protein